MDDNKLIALIVCAGLLAFTCMCIFGDGALDSDSLKRYKAHEKTQQLEIQYKIDSLKSIQK